MVTETSIILVATIAGVDPEDYRAQISELLSAGVSVEGAAQAIRMERLHSQLRGE